MTPPDAAGLVAVSPSMLRNLRQALDRSLGDQGAHVLQEVGFTSGDEVYEAFAEWLREQAAVEHPSDLDAAYLGEMLSGFFARLGWGDLVLERLGPSALALDATNWVENARTEGDANSGPVCHFSTGLFAALFGRLAEDVVAVMEVENPDATGTCRFLVGAPATLQAVFEAMSQGADYEAVLSAAAPDEG